MKNNGSTLDTMVENFPIVENIAMKLKSLDVTNIIPGYAIGEGITSSAPMQSLMNYDGPVESLGVSIVVALAVHHIAISSVSILLHRSETHKSVELVDWVKKSMDAIVRMTSPIIPKEWVGAHKKHHAVSDEVGDPHSPQPVTGTPIQIFLKEFCNLDFRTYMKAVDKLYETNRIKGDKPGMIERVGPMMGLGAIYVSTFGVKNAAVMATIQAVLGRATITLVNGVGHGAGERGGKTNDFSKNINSEDPSYLRSIWDNIILNFECGGEQFHGNHHNKMRSADISLGQEGKIDIGYWYIKQLEKIGLASNIKT